jgi:hypothetical protein
MVWMLVMLAETLHGSLREIFIAPLLGGLRARQLGVLAGSALILLIAWATARWMGAATRQAQLVVGGYWAVLTLAFEFVLGRALGLDWSRIFADYDPTRGGFLVLGLAFMVFAPLLAAKIRSL